MDTLSIAIAAGLSLGLVLGYRFSKAVVHRVGGPCAREPLAIGLAVTGALGFLAPAALFAVFGTRNLGGPAGHAISSGAPSVLLGVAAGITVVIASGLVVGAFAGALCARFIAEFRSQR
jgi:branched-subunit amino acid transport protein